MEIFENQIKPEYYYGNILVSIIGITLVKYCVQQHIFAAYGNTNPTSHAILQ